MLYLIASFLFFITLLRNILFWTALWQTKEYRLDRLLVHVKETRQGKAVFFNFSSLFLWFILFSYIGVVLYDSLSFYFQILIVAYFGMQCVVLVKDIQKRSVKKPRFTLKASIIICLTILGSIVLFFFPVTDKFVWMLLLLLLTPLLVVINVFLFSFPTEIYTDYLAQKAAIKMKKLKKITVIAVSGSYGKSSTKEIVAHILSQKYTVVKTSLSNNTTIAIAQTILKKVHSDTDFFVVEMGAYKKGEIAQLCVMVDPDISITTSVSDQHLSLYGGIDAVIDSEMELIHALPKNGLSLFNGNSTLTSLLFSRTKKNKLFYKVVSKKTTRNSVIQASDVIPTKNGTSFSFSYKKTIIHMSSPLIGMHTVENILPAIYLGNLYGLSAKDMQKALNTLKPLSKTMEKRTLRNGAIAIDDTFNASPESCIAASKYAQLYSSKKFFILTPLIELGKVAKERHREIGKALAHMDIIFLTNKNFLSDILQGIQSVKGSAEVVTGSYQDIITTLQSVVDKKSVVIFEGKEAGVVLKKLI